MGICSSSGAAPDDEKEQIKTEEKSGPEPTGTGDIHKQYQFLRTLGKGASCRVVEAVDKEDRDQKLAIKIMSKEKAICSTLYKHEVEILSQLNHPSVLRLKGHQEDDNNFYVITTLLEGGELFDRIVNPDFVITEKIAAALILSMLEALDYCHKQHIVHRDLKPENFVFQNTSRDSPLVVIDFGCAKTVEDEAVYKDLVGTVYYLAPELAAQSSRVPTTGAVLKAADLWSMGVITYVMLTGRPPFKGRSNKEIFTRIIKDPLQFPDDVNLSESFKEFVNKCLQKNPYKRISLEDAIRHPWVQGKTAADFQLNKDVIRYLRQFNYQSKLKKAITRCLAANMSEEPEKEVKRHFARLDKDGDGFLDADELTLLLLDMGFANHKAGDEAKKMLESADLNKDGAVDFGEFKAVWHRKLLTQHEQYIHRVFSVFDDNGDGYVDAVELQGVLGDDFGAIKDMIAEVDSDNDQKINFSEFKNAMQEKATPSSMDVEGMNAGANAFNGEDRIEDDLISDPQDETKADE